VSDIAHRVFILKKINRTSGMVEQFKTVIDREDAYLLRSMIWHVQADRNGNVYVARSQSGVFEFLHKQLIGAGEYEFVEHLNGNTLDNRKINLKAHKKSTEAHSAYAKTKVNVTPAKAATR
jgi:hypothetical protein